MAKMESFVAKICDGGGVCFDPMMEEKGGWISGEAPRRHVEHLMQY